MTKARQKGNQFERDICKILRCIFPSIATSRLMNRDADNRGVDVINTPGYAIQCKRYGKKYPNLEKVIEEMNTKDRKLVVHKRDHKAILVTMTIDTLLSILND